MLDFPKAIPNVAFTVHEVQEGIDRELRNWWQFIIERKIDEKLTSNAFRTIIYYREIHSTLNGLVQRILIDANGYSLRHSKICGIQR